MTTRIAMLLLLLGLAAPSRASDVALDAALSTNVLHVGDRATFTLTATHPADRRIVIPPLGREPLLVIHDSHTTQRDLADGRRQTIATVAFSSFVIGEHRVSTNHLLVLAGEGKEESLPFPEVVFRVDSLLTNPPPALADIKPPVKLPGLPDWLKVLLMILAVAALAVPLAWALRRWLRRPSSPAPLRTLPPHDIALAALDALRQRGLIEQGQYEEFYVELSAIVRLYLEDRFDLHAPEQTTEEFIRTSSQSNALSAEHRALTQQFLEQSDLVKFARFEPGAGDMTAAWDAAARLVRETVPAPATPEGAP